MRQAWVDLFNNDSRQLVWKGASQEDLSSNSEKNAKDLDKDIDKMFKDLPPREKK